MKVSHQIRSKHAYLNLGQELYTLRLTQEKRLFIKDMAYFLVPPNGEPASIAPSFLSSHTRCCDASPPCHEPVGIDIDIENLNLTSSVSDSPTSQQCCQISAEPGNPTVVPLERLSKYHYTFLIRHPRLAIPSYYRCTIPPLSSITGVHKYQASDAGYAELRRFFDFLNYKGVIGPSIAGRLNSHGFNNAEANANERVEICVIDAEDLLTNAPAMMEAYCRIVNIPYQPDMLHWNSREDHLQATETFQKWRGFHEDAIKSQGLIIMEHVSAISILLVHSIMC
jgi:hypothetical protein